MAHRLRNQIAGMVMRLGWRMMSPRCKAAVSVIVNPGWRWANENMDEFEKMIEEVVTGQSTNSKE